MQQIFNNIKFIVGDADVLGNMEHVRALPLFSEMTLSFLDALSKGLMHHPDAKKYPDIIAFAFWIRKASLEKLAIQYKSNAQRIGRGTAFHIAPSNIPVQFAVSLVYALVAGNASIIRISNKSFEQVNIICSLIRDMIRDGYSQMAPYICIIRYDHSDEITQALTEACDVRLIWGGDNTIAAIRRTSIKPRCIDLGFADRYSVSIIDSDYYLSQNIDVLANDFYNDTYFSDQNACSSPRIVLWMGSSVIKAKELFWNALAKVVNEKYIMEPICCSDKLLRTAVVSAKYQGVKEIKNDNYIVRIEISQLYDDIMDYKGNCGYFFEYNVKDIQEIVPLLKKECQTITFIGDIESEIRQVIDNYGVKGVDRIVPVGHAGDISFVWDGLDMPIVLSRQIGNS